MTSLLEQAHRAGTHAVPVFGCPVCVAMRDYWTCGCGSLRLNSVSHCTKCKRESPATRAGRERRKRAGG